MSTNDEAVARLSKWVRGPFAEEYVSDGTRDDIRVILDERDRMRAVVEAARDLYIAAGGATSDAKGLWIPLRLAFAALDAHMGGKP